MDSDGFYSSKKSRLKADFAKNRGKGAVNLEELQMTALHLAFLGLGWRNALESYRMPMCAAGNGVRVTFLPAEPSPSRDDHQRIDTATIEYEDRNDFADSECTQWRPDTTNQTGEMNMNRVNVNRQYALKRRGKHAQGSGKAGARTVAKHKRNTCVESPIDGKR